MSRFAISQCTFEDAEAIGRVNVNSFWTDDNWVLLWRGKTKEYVASQSARRSAQNLSKDDTYRRHQKVVDLSTGRIVGYARWVLPETGLKNPECQWPSAKVPEYTKEQKIQAVREYSAADWEWDSSLDELDIKVNALKQQVTRGRIFITLDYLTVHPDYRKMGIGSMLVNSGLIVAQKMDLDAFVVAMKVALGVYQRSGFKLVGQVIQDDTKYGGKGEWGVYFLFHELLQRKAESIVNK